MKLTKLIMLSAISISLSFATNSEEKHPNEITMDDALILIEKRKDYDRNKKKK